jgi:hypothetical protein
MTRKVCLALGLAVLLVHLSLLHGLSLNLKLATVASDTPTLSFTTRTLVMPAPPAALALPEPADSLETAANAPNISTRQDALANDAPPTVPSPQLSTTSPSTEQATPPEPEPVQAAVPGQPFQFNADGLPGSVKLIYQVAANKFPYRLSSELLWLSNNQQYQAQLSVNALGFSRIQNSRGRMGREGLLPERFSDKTRSEVAAHFNYERGIVSFSANTPDVPLQAGVQDRLSVLIQLAALVASQPSRFPIGSQISIQTVGPREADMWLFGFGAMETLDLPGGTFAGLKLVRLPRQPYDQKLEVWLAPHLSYLPARIRITESNGDFIDQLWKASENVQAP